MTTLIANFLSSKGITIALLLAVAGGVWWITYKVQEAEQTALVNTMQAQTIAEQQLQIKTLSGSIKELSEGYSKISNYQSAQRINRSEVIKIVNSISDDRQRENLNANLPNELISIMCKSGQFTKTASAKHCAESLGTVSNP